MAQSRTDGNPPETRKLDAEARQFNRQFWLVVVGAMSAGAALFGAAVIFVKLVLK